MTILVCRSTRVLLPGSSDLQPASIAIDRLNGKIINVSTGMPQLVDQEYDLLDMGDKVILPALVEYV